MNDDRASLDAGALRRRLLERVADADVRHLTVTAEQGAWQALAPGVRLKLLHVRDGAASYLVQLQPGARLPAHRHPMDEECLVLEGRVRVGSRLEAGPGDFHVAWRGSLHATLSTDTGALLFLRGAIPRPEDVLG